MLSFFKKRVVRDVVGFFIPTICAGILGLILAGIDTLTDRPPILDWINIKFIIVVVGGITIPFSYLYFLSKLDAGVLTGNNLMEMLYFCGSWVVAGIAIILGWNMSPYNGFDLKGSVITFFLIMTVSALCCIITIIYAFFKKRFNL